MIEIRQDFGQGRIVATRRAASLKQALLEFYKETLTRYGYTNPKVVGNVLTVESIRAGQEPYKTYIATEAK
jgi:hypothetical protein